MTVLGRTPTEGDAVRSEAFGRISARSDAFIETLAAHVRQPTISAHGTGMDAGAEMTADLVADSGLEPRLLAAGGFPAVFGQRVVDPSLPTVLFYGHYDVQPADDVTDWNSPPFEPTLRDGRMYGRGTSDNKGQHVANLLGIQTLLAVSPDVPVNIKVLIEGEEEIASPTLLDIVQQNAELLAADVAIVSDGSLAADGRPMVVCGSRGLLYLELRVDGAPSELHSGNWGGIVRNPVWDLLNALQSLRRPDGSIAVEGFEVGIRAVSCDELDAVHRLDPPAERRGESPNERTRLWPNLNIAGLSAGYGGPGMKTIVPASATAKLDLRLVPDQEPVEIARRIMEHVRAVVPDVNVNVIGSTPPSRTAFDHPWVRRLESGLSHAGLGTPVVVPSLAGTVPMYVFPQGLDVPAVMVPYANSDQNNHGRDENITLDNFLFGMRSAVSMLVEALPDPIP